VYFGYYIVYVFEWLDYVDWVEDFFVLCFSFLGCFDYGWWVVLVGVGCVFGLDLVVIFLCFL